MLTRQKLTAKNIGAQGCQDFYDGLTLQQKNKYQVKWTVAVRVQWHH